MKEQKFVISGLLSVGFLSLLVAVSPILSPNPNADQKAITWGGLGVGAVCFGLAGYLVWQIKSPKEKSESTQTFTQVQTSMPQSISEPTVIQPQNSESKPTSQPTVIQTQNSEPKPTSQPTVIQPQNSESKPTSQPTVIQTQNPVHTPTSQPTVIQTQNPAHRPDPDETPSQIPNPTPKPDPSAKTNFSPLDSNLLDSLETALKQQQWQHADEITAKLMLKAANQASTLTPEDLMYFPCESIKEIDRLWQIYSQNKFGFLAQVEVFNDCFSPDNSFSSLNAENWQQYAQRLGWYQTHWPNHHHELNFSLAAPKGHLPFLPVWHGAWWGGFLAGQGERFYTLIQRAKSCRLATHLNPQPINDQPPSAPDPQDPFTALGKELEGTLRIGIDTIAKGTGISQD